MTLIEVSSGSVYCTTDSKDELLMLIAFLQENIYRMETKGQKAVTIYEAFPIEPPPAIERNQPAKPDTREPI